MQSAGTRLDPVTAAAGSAHAGGRKERSAGGRRCGGGRQRLSRISGPAYSLQPGTGGGACCRRWGVRGLERSEPVADVALSGPCTASSRVGLLSTQPDFCSPEVTVRAFENTLWGYRSHKPAHTEGMWV